MKNYDELLNDLYASLPEKKTGSGERFEIPVLEANVEGVKSIVKNFDEICTQIRRESIEVARVLSKELAIPVEVVNGRLILSGKVNNKLLNEKFTSFCKGNIICKQCGKPDTHFTTEGRFKVVVCEACGAKNPASL